MLHKVNIAGLAMDPASNTPIILLKTEEGDKTLPIWIGLLEATSIASALQDIQFDRPMTHDLFKNLTQVLNVSSPQESPRLSMPASTAPQRGTR